MFLPKRFNTWRGDSQRSGALVYLQLQKMLREREDRAAQGGGVPGPEALLTVRIYKPFVAKANISSLNYLYSLSFGDF